MDNPGQETRCAGGKPGYAADAAIKSSWGSRTRRSVSEGGVTWNTKARECWSATWKVLRRYMWNVSLRQRRRFLMKVDEN